MFFEKGGGRLRSTRHFYFARHNILCCLTSGEWLSILSLAPIHADLVNFSEEGDAVMGTSGGWEAGGVGPVLDKRTPYSERTFWCAQDVEDAAGNVRCCSTKLLFGEVCTRKHRSRPMPFDQYVASGKYAEQNLRVAAPAAYAVAQAARAKAPKD